MDRFIELPGELQNGILDVFAASASLPELLSARAVCKTFEARFRYELLAKVSPSELAAYVDDHWQREEDYAPTPGLAPFNFWQDNLSTVLSYRLTEPSGAAPEMLNWLHKVADLVMEDAKNNRATVLEELAQALAVTDHQRDTVYDVVPALSGRAVRQLPHQFAPKVAYFSLKTPSDQDILAAASAIGKTSLIATLLASNLLNAAPFEKGQGLSTPINSAASTGRTASLKLLLQNKLSMLYVIEQNIVSYSQPAAGCVSWSQNRHKDK